MLEHGKLLLMYNSLATGSEWLERSTAGAIKIVLDVIRLMVFIVFPHLSYLTPSTIGEKRVYLTHT